MTTTMTMTPEGALEFFERLNIPPGTRLLDVACGAGQLTLPAARRGIEVTGLDPPPPNFPSPLLWGNESTCRERFNVATDGANRVLAEYIEVVGTRA